MNEGRAQWRRGSLALVVCAIAAAQTPTVEFNRDIRPIFSDKCYTCHGPDESKRKSKLRLDAEAGAKSDLGGHFAILPGNVARSELIQRVTSQDLGRRMPPQYAGASRLTDREIALLTRWIAQGAPWQKHWSFLAPGRRPLPEVHDRRTTPFRVDGGPKSGWVRDALRNTNRNGSRCRRLLSSTAADGYDHQRGDQHRPDRLWSGTA